MHSQEWMTDEANDAALVQRARAGDRVASSVLFERHWNLLYALCVRTLGDADLADDAAQEASVQALVSLDHLRRPESFGPWLAGIGLNVCRAWLRYRHHEAWSWDAMLGGQVVDEPLDWSADPAEVAEQADLSTRVCRAVADLPEGQRTAVLLFYLAGHTYAEVAAQLGVQVGAVKTRLHKARATLRRDLVTLWEESMVAHEAPKVTDPAVRMQVVDVRRTRANPAWRARHTVVLEEVGGGRSFLIGVGGFEATAISMLLERTETARPLTFAFMSSVLEASGGTLREVRITRLEHGTIYALAVIDGARGSQEVDARPSDAVALALLRGAPILVEPVAIETADRTRLEQFGRTIEEQLALLREHSVGPMMMVTEILRASTSQPWRKADSPAESPSPPDWNPSEHLPLFNDLARRVLDQAREEALSFNHPYIGTEHLLLGLLREDDATATHYLSTRGVGLDAVRATLMQQIGRGETPVTGEIGLTPRGRGALAAAVAGAQHLEHACVGTDHLLLGIAHEDLGLAARILVRLGVEPRSLRERKLTTASQVN